jgi:hypothetical protein
MKCNTNSSIGDFKDANRHDFYIVFTFCTVLNINWLHWILTSIPSVFSDWIVTIIPLILFVLTYVVNFDFNRDSFSQLLYSSSVTCSNYLPIYIYLLLLLSVHLNLAVKWLTLLLRINVFPCPKVSSESGHFENCLFFYQFYQENAGMMPSQFPSTSFPKSLFRIKNSKELVKLKNSVIIKPRICLIYLCTS